MDLSQGFPLYNDPKEVIQKIPPEMMEFFIFKSTVLNEGKPFGVDDIQVKAFRLDGQIITFNLSLEDVNKVMSIINGSMISDIIDSIHIPTILDYLSRSNEVVESIKVDFKDILISLGVMSNIEDMINPDNTLTNLLSKIGNPTNSKAVFLYFPEGIKNDLLYESLIQFSSNKEIKDKNNQLIIPLYPINDYNSINCLISNIFTII